MTKTENAVSQNYHTATELLCTPGLRMTNKERKSLQRVREAELTRKAQEKKPLVKFDHLSVAHRLEYRLGQKAWGQLCKWMKRVTARRKDVQAAYQTLLRRQKKLGEKTGQPSDKDITELLKITDLLQVLDIRAKRLDVFFDAIDEEISRRRKLWQSVAKAGAPKFAKQIQGALTA